jgi:arylsulfatase A-like enzyme
MDLTMSILAATNTPVPPGAQLEGRNLLPILDGSVATTERTLFWRINVPARQQRAVRQGDWKLLLDGDDLLLYNLRTDIGERNDLAMTRPELVSKLRRLISDWEQDVDAEAVAK